MRIDKRYALICLFLLVISEFGVIEKLSLAEEEKAADATFIKGALYNIYYEVSSYEAVWVESVQIIGTEKIEGKTFLVIRRSDVANRIGYILLDSVKAILPNDIKAKTIYDARPK